MNTIKFTSLIKSWAKSAALVPKSNTVALNVDTYYVYLPYDLYAILNELSWR